MIDGRLKRLMDPLARQRREGAGAAGGGSGEGLSIYQGTIADQRSSESSRRVRSDCSRHDYPCAS